jgi:hypothetical protein
VTFCVGDGGTQIRVIHPSFNEQVQVVRHEAVRKNFKVIRRSSVRKLQPHVVHQAVVRETRAIRKRAQRKEIAATPDIRTIRKA